MGFKVISSHCFSFFRANSCKIVVRVLSTSTKFSLLYYSLLNIVRKVVLIWVIWYLLQVHHEFTPSTTASWSSFTVSVLSHISYMCIADGTQKNINPVCRLCTPSRVQGMCKCKTHLWSLQKNFNGDLSCPLNFPAAKIQKLRVRIEAMTFQWSFTMCTLMSQQPIGCLTAGLPLMGIGNTPWKWHRTFPVTRKGIQEVQAEEAIRLAESQPAVWSVQM